MAAQNVRLVKDAKYPVGTRRSVTCSVHEGLHRSVRRPGTAGLELRDEFTWLGALGVSERCRLAVELRVNTERSDLRLRHARRGEHVSDQRAVGADFGLERPRSVGKKSELNVPLEKPRHWLPRQLVHGNSP